MLGSEKPVALAGFTQRELGFHECMDEYEEPTCLVVNQKHMGIKDFVFCQNCMLGSGLFVQAKSRDEECMARMNWKHT